MSFRNCEKGTIGETPEGSCLSFFHQGGSFQPDPLHAGLLSPCDEAAFAHTSKAPQRFAGVQDPKGNGTRPALSHLKRENNKRVNHWHAQKGITLLLVHDWIFRSTAVSMLYLRTGDR